jgi:hypothetical protein
MEYGFWRFCGENRFALGLEGLPIQGGEGYYQSCSGIE